MAADPPARPGTMQYWLDRWDDQQAGHSPDRRQRFDVLADLVEGATAGRPQPLVLDLACGPGSVTRHLLDRLARTRPNLQIVALDVDPVLLRIAAGTIGSEPAVRLVEADLRHADWASSADLPAAAGGAQFDAVVTATALHWLPASDLERLYADLAQLIRPGGVFADGDHIPLDGVTSLARLTEEIREVESVAQLAQAGVLDWEGWWEAIEADPGFTTALMGRRERFSVTHPAEFIPPESWHVDKLVKGGFSEAAVVWRRYGDAVVAAIR
jgi:SAM-dependent methyltransferase